MSESVEVKIARLEENQSDMHRDIHEIKSDVRDIKATLAGRPSWLVTLALTVLSSLCVGLAVALANLR